MPKLLNHRVMIRTYLLCAWTLWAMSVSLAQVAPAAKPLYRDPGYDGAADPVVIWHEQEEKWFMFYTNRRANLEGSEGVEWVHGTRIGIAESADEGRSWTYRDTCHIAYGAPTYSHWAPKVIAHEGTYHMYLTVVPGTFADWRHPRQIVHLTSQNLIDWDFQSQLALASDKCIDACVFPLPDGGWRMYYNNEKDGKSIYYADSPDLYAWHDQGTRVVGDQPGEAPKVFAWQGRYWMCVDVWRGIGVYASDDLLHWERQADNLLSEPGVGEDDRVKGGHCDVVVNDDRAYLFYFTHPGRTPENEGRDSYLTRRSSIQVVELRHEDGQLTCDRNQPVYLHLDPTK
jgi:beta-xylosidase